MRIIYTEIFGVYSGWAFYRTWAGAETLSTNSPASITAPNISKGNLWVPIFLHSQCNWFGVPNIGQIFDRTTYIPRKVLIAVFYLSGILLFIIFKDKLTF